MGSEMCIRDSPKIVDVNMRRLRIKIEDDPAQPKHINTIWGFGYRWEA